MFATLSYSTSINLGDEIQSIAARDLLVRNGVHPSVTIDRDLPTDPPVVTHCIYNGWFDGDYCTWPPPGKVDPLFISFHINEIAKGKEYNVLEKLSHRSSLSDASFASYYEEHSPIGCRDLHTLGKFLRSGIDAYFSGCLTMTLKGKHEGERHGTYLVDAFDLPKRGVPGYVLDGSVTLSHVARGGKSKTEQAEELLSVYQSAKLVITSRLHAALPCLAYGTPCVFVPGDPNHLDPRLSGLESYLVILGRNYISWNHVQLPDDDSWRQLAEGMEGRVSDWISDRVHYNGQEDR